jgi:hypothetical protein
VRQWYPLGAIALFAAIGVGVILRPPPNDSLGTSSEPPTPALHASPNAIFSPASNVVARDISYGHTTTTYHGPTARQQIAIAELDRLAQILGQFDRLAVRNPMHEEAIPAMVDSLEGCRQGIAKLGANSIFDEEFSNIIDSLKSRLERICSIVSEAQKAVTSTGSSVLFYYFGPSSAKQWIGPSDPAVASSLDAIGDFVKGRLELMSDSPRAQAVLPERSAGFLTGDFIGMYAFGNIDQIKTEIRRELVLARERLNKLRLEAELA